MNKYIVWRIKRSLPWLNFNNLAELYRNRHILRDVKFWDGWERKSAMRLDVAGCPVWLNRWRCDLSPHDKQVISEAFSSLVNHE